MTNWKSQILLIFFSISLCSPIGPNDFQTLIIWNVGQGSWSTLRHGSTCFHFDAGGETAPLRQIAAFCEKRKNILFLSHDDFDHIRYAGWLARQLKSCWAISPRLQIFFQRLKNPPPLCADSNLEPLLIHAPSRRQRFANLQSLVYISNRILFPGDAPSASEKLWRLHPQVASVRYLLLGHHGSRTSSSEELLEKTLELKMAFASSRRRRYGHPHAETLWRLQRHRVPILSTEDWGHIELRL